MMRLFLFHALQQYRHIQHILSCKFLQYFAGNENQKWRPQKNEKEAPKKMSMTITAICAGPNKDFCLGGGLNVNWT